MPRSLAPLRRLIAAAAALIPRSGQKPTSDAANAVGCMEMSPEEGGDGGGEGGGGRGGGGGV